MATYLLTWNPNKWHWDDLRECVDKAKARGHFDTQWSCGVSRMIRVGDRVFILRQGVEPRGIFGAGRALSGVIETPHWDETKAAEGKAARSIEVRFDTLLNPEAEPILPREWLGRGRLAPMYWNTQMSGVTIPPGVAEALEEEWERFLRTRDAAPFTIHADPPDEATRRRETSTLRIVRDTRQAREIKRLYDFTCQVCGVRLEGSAGPYAEAAHIRPLGAPHDGPDAPDNLLCLCPNHHVLFDLHGFTIADDLTLIGLTGRLKVHRRHEINREHLRYHREHYSV